jgi:lipopolysaccharide export system permease protein
MVKRLDLYLMRQFFLSLLVVTAAVGLTIIVINMVEELRDFIDHKVPLASILEYYVYFGGWVIKTFTPMFVMLATLFSLSILARKLEILAMKASGISLYRLALPFLVVTALISVMHFYYNEYLFPPANKKRVEIKKFTIEKHSKSAFTTVRNVYRQVSPGHFYTVAKFDIERGEGTDLKVFETERNELRRIITAKQLTFRNHVWQASDGIVRYFSDSAGESFHRFDSLILWDIKDQPEDFARLLGKPEDMGLDELRRYINVMKRTGGPYLREQIDLKMKYAYPLTSFIVVLVCIPFASNPRRGGIAVSFAAGALIALTYFVLFRITQSAGYNEKIPENLAVWGVNGLFFIVGLGLLIRARK